MDKGRNEDICTVYTVIPDNLYALLDLLNTIQHNVHLYKAQEKLNAFFFFTDLWERQNS